MGFNFQRKKQDLKIWCGWWSFGVEKQMDHQAPWVSTLAFLQHCQGWRVAHRWSPSHMDTKFDQVWSGWFTFQIGATSLASWKQAFLYVIIVWNPSAFPSYRNANKSQNKRLCDHNIPHCRDLSKFQANGFGQFIYLPQSTDRQADQNKEWNSGTSSTCSKKGCWMSGMLLDGFKPLSGWWWMVFSNSVLLQLIVERIYEAIHN